MNTVIAHQKYIRTSARKMRLVADMVRGMKVDLALTQLAFSSKRAAKVVAKVVNQAMKNAVNTKNMVSQDLVIQSIVVDDGPIYKRWRPVSRGRAHPIMKRTSHLKVIVSGKDIVTPKTLPAVTKTIKAKKTKTETKLAEKKSE
jgi:large subunit ribosomal protein L22